MKRCLVWCLTLLMLVSVVAYAGLENAQKISELKGGNESLMEFLKRLPTSFEAQIFYALVLFSTIGMFINYAQKWLRREITGSLIVYLFYDNIRGTLLSAGTAVSVGLVGIGQGVFESPSGEFVGWMNVLWVSVSNGFMWDAALNRGGNSGTTPTAS